MEGGAAVRQTTQDATPLPLPKKLTSYDLNNQANNTQTHLGSTWNRSEKNSYGYMFKICLQQHIPNVASQNGGVGRVRGREAEFDGPWTRGKSVQNSSRREAMEVERGRNMITRVSFSQKVVEWICHGFGEESLNQREKESSNIIPECSFNSGWLDIALKIMDFINAKRTTTKCSRQFSIGNSKCHLVGDTLMVNEYLKASSWNLVLKESLTPTRLVVANVKTDNKKSEVGVDLAGRATTTGCEEIVEEMVIKTDGNRESSIKEAKALILMIPKTKKRLMIKRLMHNWKAGVSCFQETKLQGDIKDITKDLWSNSWESILQVADQKGRRTAQDITKLMMDDSDFVEAWESSFRDIKQPILHRVTSDHCPVILECDN
ncbi:hypothetical protein H5410_027832 [Solanum commersonii]|uniref:Uncharacterized protein n=1 Tax=Solanum commersonii TaxID=4109 RepID=A0A9J5Z4H7_SOLCO|nr:hypothetical protein H5410_027832 [Solanum commersonii]